MKLTIQDIHEQVQYAEDVVDNLLTSGVDCVEVSLLLDSLAMAGLKLTRIAYEDEVFTNVASLSYLYLLKPDAVLQYIEEETTK